jgi:hypothetical protein
MRARIASITFAAAVAAAVSVSAAQAGMNNLNVSPALSPRVTPSIPDVKVRPIMIDARIKLHCYYTRERNELGVWVTRRHCN